MMMLPLLADVLNKNEWDNDLLGKLLQIVVVFAGLWGAHALGKRKPSVGEDLSTYGERLKQAEAAQRRLFAHRDEFEESMSDMRATLEGMRSVQGANATALGEMNKLMHDVAKELRDDGRTVENMVENRLNAISRQFNESLQGLTRRVDEAVLNIKRPR